MRLIQFLNVGVLLVIACAKAIGGPSEDDTNWPYLGGTANSQQFSPLTQIKTSDISTLGLLRHADLPIREGLVGNPLVLDGVAYQSFLHGGAIAVGLRDAKVLWKFEPSIDFSNQSWVSMWESNATRGIAVDEKHAYTISGCHLFAIDRKTGHQVWHTLACDPTKDEGTRAAPRVGAGKVFVGIGNLELGTSRGFAAAFDSTTGKQLWRFYVVPGDPSKSFENKQMEMAAKTWPADYWTRTHGGAAGVWEGMIYDPKTNFLIFGTGNPGPHGASDWAHFSGHDLLFSSALMAVDAGTGEYRWHYQTLPGDVWGFSDATAHLVLADLPLPNGTRHVVMSAEKQFFYVFDAKTGEFISMGDYVPQTNFSTIDRKSGRLTVREALKVWTQPPGTMTVMNPSEWGGHTWQLTSYNPDMRLFYIPAYIIPVRFGFDGYDWDFGMKAGSTKSQGRLLAWDPIAEKERWHVDLSLPLNGGVLSTAGGLVFHGTSDGLFKAYDATSGQELWTYDTHSILHAAPSTVMVDGKQLILMPAGDGTGGGTANVFPGGSTTPQTATAPSRLLMFGLGGKEVLPANQPKAFARPAEDRPSADWAQRGKGVFEERHCNECHGYIDMSIVGGRVIDLRRLPSSVLDLLPSILRDGLFVPMGMPRFSDISDEDLRALRAYIVVEQWRAYERAAETNEHH